jgi:hypothetical protein
MGSESIRSRKPCPSDVVEYREVFIEPIGELLENRVAILRFFCETLPSKYGPTVTCETMVEATRNRHHRLIALGCLVDRLWVVVLPSCL